VIIFDSIQFCFLSKKSNKTGFFLKINRNRFKPTGFGSVILEQKQVFFRFGLVFSVWLGFGLVRFGFLGFKLIKPKPNRTGRFFINFYRFFFHGYVFFIIFFQFNRFFDFFYTALTQIMDQVHAISTKEDKSGKNRQKGFWE
jgi:hypothetical protein